MSKTCVKCKITKPLDDFHNDKGKKDGKRNDCKACKNAHISIDLKAREDVEANGKICAHCKVQKPASEFYDRKQSSDGKIGQCKECYDKHQKERQDNDPNRFEKQVVKVRRYRDKHKERINRENKERKHNDPGFKLRHLLSKRIRDCVARKSNTFQEYLGCSIDYFIKWMEFLFKLDHKMNWDNHNTYWHYDHVKPCNSFDLTNVDEAKQCFNWRNIRPCEKRENMAKRHYIIEDVIKQQEHYAEEFITTFGAPN